jgi:hypothetical protein
MLRNGVRMVEAVIGEHTERKMRRLGKRDGRRWRWGLKPWFIHPKEPSPNAGETAPAIQHVAEAAEEMIAHLQRRWHEADGAYQKKAKDAVVELQRHKDQPDQDKYRTLISRARGAYGDAKIERQTAWNVLRTDAKAVGERYSQLAQAYAGANQAARRETRVEIEVPELLFPDELSDSGPAAIEKVLGLDAAVVAALSLASGSAGPAAES